MQVVRIGYTVVKGGRHVARPEVEFAPTGPVGDRVFCLVDLARGRVVRTVENPALLRTVAHWDAGVLRVELPEATVEGTPASTGTFHTVDYWGRSVPVELLAGPWAAAYSRLLGHEVALARPTVAGGVVYAGSVSIVTTGAMAWLEQRAGARLEPERFRSTLVLDTGAAPEPVEQGWLGRELCVGTARVQVRVPIPRCAVIDLDPVTGHRRRGSLLKSLATPSAGSTAGVDFGVDAVVTSAGRVRLGDPATCR